MEFFLPSLSSLNSCSFILVSLKTPGQDQCRNVPSSYLCWVAKHHLLLLKEKLKTDEEKLNFVDTQEITKLIIKKRSSTSISVSKHRILCRCPTGTKVVRHWYQWLGVATAWYSQPGLGVLINNFTERQHWKRPLCAQDVFCQKGFLCFFFVTGILYIYIYFTYTCDYILMNTR